MIIGNIISKMSKEDLNKIGRINGEPKNFKKHLKEFNSIYGKQNWTEESKRKYYTRNSYVCTKCKSWT